MSPTYYDQRPRRVRDLSCGDRRVYLDFEGELSGRRGRVTRVAAGECEVDVGENARWAIRLLTGPHAGWLTLEWKTGDIWEGRP